MSYCKGDVRRFQLAEVFLFTSPGAPSVFYGDELGMDGNSEYLLRGPMPWDNPKSDEREFFRKLIELRTKNDALAIGTFKELLTDEDGLYIYERSMGGRTITIALNARDCEKTLDLIQPFGSVVMSERYEDHRLGAFGYAIWM